MYRHTFVCSGTVPGAGANLISHTLYPELSETSKLAGYILRLDAADTISSAIVPSFIDGPEPHAANTPENRIVSLATSVALTPSATAASIDTDLDYPRTWNNGLQFGGVLTTTGAGTYTIHVTVWG